MAVGASAGHVWRGVVSRTVVLAGVGVAAGAAVSLGTSGVLRSLLFEVGPNDPASFAGAAALLLLVSALAGYVPARRASRTEPVIALRAP